MTQSSTADIKEAGPAEPATERRTQVNWRDYSMVTALVLIFAYFTTASPLFVSARNLSNLAVEFSITAILSLGMLLIILTGNIDLSIGSGAALIGAIAATLTVWDHWPAPLSMLLGIIVAVAVWAAMGSVITSHRIPSFIITLAGMQIFRGLQLTVIHNGTVPVTPIGATNLYAILTTWYLPAWAGWAVAVLVFAAMIALMIWARWRQALHGVPQEPLDLALSKLIIRGQLLLLFVLVCNQYLGVPLSAVILGVTAVAIWTLTQHTRFGRYLYAIGGNEEAARISGVPIGKVLVVAFGVMGLIVALGGYLQTAYPGYSTGTTGEGLELDAIAACVIGGASLKGGAGTVSGVLFGSLIMSSLVNGMTLLAVGNEQTLIVRGVVLAAAVWMDVKMARR